MEWKIPEPLSIRPCQRPSDFKPRQLNLYPVKLKKLPSWVNQATFEPHTLKKDVQPQLSTCNQQNSLENELSMTLQTKYKSKQKYVLLYERGQQKYQFNQNFAHQYIPTNYSVLQEHVPKQKRQRQQPQMESGQDESNVYSLQSSEETIKNYNIQFDSKFECGNISKVYQVTNSSEYHLLMQNDINTLGYNQWYAFSVFSHSDEIVKIQFRIVNFIKQRSLYKKGMKPWIIHEGTKTWRQLEGNCSYKKTNTRNESGDPYYELEFSLNLSPGLTYISMLPIYSYSRLRSNIQRWKSIQGMTIYSKKVFTLVNNIVPILQYIPGKCEIIASANEKGAENSENQREQFNETTLMKQSLQTVVIFARIHPGEVWSSFLMEQIVESVISYYKQPKSSDKNDKLRFLFFPMLNPDGVIYGNFRCDFSGVDLNRVWIEPSKFTQCSIYQIKKILNKQFLSNKAAYFIDLHSHSKAFNVFAYTSAENIQESRLLSDMIRLSEDNAIFDPVQPSFKLENDFIKQGQTTFLSSKDIFLSKKKSTARAFMSRLTEKGRSMTIEISFYGYLNKRDDENPLRSFQPIDFKNLSECLISKLHQVLLNENEEFLKSKKTFQALYTNYLLSSTHENHLNPRRQHKILQQEKDLTQDSDSQPQKYYTNQTKKLIKSKNGELHDSKVIIYNDNKKSYMKQTQSMIHKSDLSKKDKIFDRAKIHSFRNVSGNRNKKDDPGKKTSISEYPMRVESQRKKKPSMIEKQSFNNLDLDMNFSGDKHNMFRKKILVQSKNKQKKQTVQNRSQVVDNKKDFINNAAFEPMFLDESKKYEPVFGQFLTKSKRSASRRYKTVTRQEFTVYQSQMVKLRKNDIKQNLIKKPKTSSGLCEFLEDNMYIVDMALPKTENYQKTIQTIEQQPENRQSRNAQKKGNQPYYESKLKKNGIDRANNFKNIYMFERKKIVEMMKKETRFYNVVQKQPYLLGQVGEIIDKRKRAKTEYDSFKTSYNQPNIFFHTKNAKLQKS